MNSIRRAARVGKVAVRFILKVKVVSMILPGVADGSKVFVVMERGKNRKSWTKTQEYVSSTANPERKKYSIEKWADEVLEIPVTLYRGQTGDYQKKPFKIKVMRDPTGASADYGTSVGDSPQLASFTLDASEFCIFSDMEQPKIVRVQKLTKKSTNKEPSLQVGVCCLYSHDATGDEGSIASSARTGSSAGARSDDNDLSNFEQDLSGFEELSEEGKSKWGSWFSSKGSGAKSTSMMSPQGGGHAFPGEGLGKHRSIREGELEGLAEERESMVEGTGEGLTFNSIPLGGAAGGGRGGGAGGWSKEGTKGSSSKFMSMFGTSSGRNRGGGGGGGGGGGNSAREREALARQERAANETAVAEMLRALQLQDYIRAIVIELGFDDLEVLRSLRPHEFDQLAVDAGLKQGHATKLRLRLGIPRNKNPQAAEAAARTAALDLVGKWVEVEGMGCGRVIAWNPVWNHLFFDSTHTVDFSGNPQLPTASLFEISRRRRDKGGQGLSEVRLLLRRRKFGRWNRGCHFEIVPDPYSNS